MKKLMIMGGLLGFLIGISVGLAQHSSWPSILWRASVAALSAGFLLRWWGNVWITCLAEAHQQKLAAAEAQRQQQQPQQRPAVKPTR
jgi:hypothetical protein